MPVQGFTRLRKHQFGRQSVMGTKVAATRAYPFTGVPAHNLNWTDSEVDVGSIVNVIKPTRGIPDLTWPESAPQLDYNSATIGFAAVLGGNISPAAGIWSWAPSAIQPLDPFDLFTGEFGDDVTNDWFQYGDGFLESFQITGAEGNGACTGALSWRFGSIASSGSTDSPASPTVPTGGLDVDTAPPILYQKDLGIYIASSTGGLAAGQIVDALHTFELTLAQTVDVKRFANATQSFDADDYGRTGYTVELNATFAKTADTVGTGSESDAWMSDDAVDRYMELKWTSLTTPNALDIVFPARYYTRTEGDSGGNSVIVLNAHAFYDADDLDGFLTVDLHNTLTDAELGTIAS